MSSVFHLVRAVLRAANLQWWLWAEREIDRRHEDAPAVTRRVDELRRGVRADLDAIRNPAPRRRGGRRLR